MPHSIAVQEHETYKRVYNSVIVEISTTKREGTKVKLSHKAQRELHVTH